MRNDKFIRGLFIAKKSLFLLENLSAQSIDHGRILAGQLLECFSTEILATVVVIPSDHKISRKEKE